MNPEWPSPLVGQLQKEGTLLVEDGNHGEYRPRLHEFGEGETCFIRASDISNGRVLFETADRINELALGRVRKGIGAPGDILFSHKGTVGKMALVTQECPPFVCSPQTTFWRTLNENLLDRAFLFYFMKSHAFSRQWQSRKGETDMADYVSLTAQRQLSIQLPEIDVQRAIGKIMSPLDDKIELNREMNQTLEAMAQAIFRSWFVNFDPVVAKSEGRRPFGLSDEVAALFPDRLVESELGAIPEGWGVEPLKNLTSKIGSGATPKGGKASYVEDGMAFIRSQNVYDSEFRWGGLARITDEQADLLRGVAVKPGDILLNITGASMLRTCVVDTDVLPARVNQHVAIVRASAEVPHRFLHQHLLEPATKAYLFGLNSGASREAITKGHIESLLLANPSRQILRRFEVLVNPFFAKSESNVAESRSLAGIRDLLLPKLLSGEIRVKQAEKIVEEVL